MKKVLSLILALCLLLTMSCAMAEDVIARDYERTETTATDPATGREVDLNNIYVAAVNKSMGSFWMDGANTEGTAWAERTDGVTWGYYPAATVDAAAQMSALSDALATDPDVLLISPTSGEAVNEDGDAFVAAKLKAAAKQLRRDLGPQANDPESLPCRLEAAARLFDEEKDLKKRAKEAREALDTKTKATIEGLTDEQALAMLNAKWVKPLVAEFHMLPDAVIDGLVEKVQALRDKYSETYADIDAQIQQAESELVGMLGQLTGNEYDMAGINELAKLLGGELR